MFACLPCKDLIRSSIQTVAWKGSAPKSFTFSLVLFFMKRWIWLITPPFVYQFLKRLAPRNRYHSLNELDKKIEKYLPYDNGFYVELGANDGVAQSNTLYFEQHRNWQGVLIEPIPHKYLLCRKNRSARNRIFSCACTSFHYKEKFVPIAYSNLMSAAIGLESYIEDPVAYAHKGKQHLEESEEPFIFGALARTLNDVLIEANAPATIDLLSLDVEGAEMEVLKGIDHNRFRFKYMCIENRHKETIMEYLRPHGYEYVEQLSELDHLFKDSRSS